MQIAQAVDSPGARWKALAGPLVLFACTLAGLWLAASVSGSPALSASAFAPVASPTPCTSQDYSVITSTGATLVPGVVDTGNHCDDCPTTITLPFPYVFYGIPYTMVTASSNGNLQFTTSNATYLNECLPASSIQFAIFPHWTDMLTNHADGGIFT